MNKKYLGGIFAAAVVGLAGTFGAGTAQADGFSCSTAKLIVPWKAGGGTAVIFNIFENIINNDSGHQDAGNSRCVGSSPLEQFC